MARPKQSVTGNLILLGVLLLPVIPAVLVYTISGSGVAGWLTLAATFVLVLAALAAFVAAMHVSTTHPHLSKTELAWLSILIFTAAMILMAVPLLIVHW